MSRAREEEEEEEERGRNHREHIVLLLLLTLMGQNVTDTVSNCLTGESIVSCNTIFCVSINPFATIATYPTI